MLKIITPSALTWLSYTKVRENEFNTNDNGSDNIGSSKINNKITNPLRKRNKISFGVGFLISKVSLTFI